MLGDAATAHPGDRGDPRGDTDREVDTRVVNVNCGGPTFVGLPLRMSESRDCTVVGAPVAGSIPGTGSAVDGTGSESSG